MASETSTEVKVYNGVYTALTKAGMSGEPAKRYAMFAVDVYVYIRDSPRLQAALSGLYSVYKAKGDARDAVVAFGYAERASNIGMDASALRFAGKGNASVGGLIGGFVDYCASLAKLSGIQMNECAISVTKVMLDVLTVVAMTETVVGVWAAAMQALCTVKDTTDMVDACFQTK